MRMFKWLPTRYLILSTLIYSFSLTACFILFFLSSLKVRTMEPWFAVGWVMLGGSLMSVFVACCLMEMASRARRWYLS